MGGSPTPPVTYSPMEQAQAQMAIDQANYERQQQQRQVEEAARLQQEQQQRAATAGQISNLFNTGQSYGTSMLGNLGYQDTYGIMDRYSQALNAARARVPETADDVGNYFNFDQMFRDAQTQAQTAQQTRLHNDYMGATPVGWQQNYIANDYGGDILQAILDQQAADVNTRFETAAQRGQLSQGAYGNIQNRMGGQRDAAMSTLRDFADSILGGYRDQLGNTADQWSNRIQNYQLGQDVSLDRMNQTLRSEADRLLGRFSGDLNRQVGDTQLFNPDALMARASAAAGVSNNPLRQAFAGQAANNNTEDDNRTTGTSGLF